MSGQTYKPEKNRGGKKKAKTMTRVIRRTEKIGGEEDIKETMRREVTDERG